MFSLIFLSDFYPYLVRDNGQCWGASRNGSQVDGDTWAAGVLEM